MTKPFAIELYQLVHLGKVHYHQARRGKFWNVKMDNNTTMQILLVLHRDYNKVKWGQF
jgi:hypothetical protein